MLRIFAEQLGRQASQTIYDAHPRNRNQAPAAASMA